MGESWIDWNMGVPEVEDCEVEDSRRRLMLECLKACSSDSGDRIGIVDVYPNISCSRDGSYSSIALGSPLGSPTSN